MRVKNPSHLILHDLNTQTYMVKRTRYELLIMQSSPTSRHFPSAPCSRIEQD